MTRSRADIPPTPRQSRPLLLATDNKNSVLAEIAGGKPQSIAYSAYGQQSAQPDVATSLGFNGARREKHIGWYLLGNGYRAYNPASMRFHSPDSWSPFRGGGLNAYMYCAGDPVNFSDPTGHMKSFFKTLTRPNRNLNRSTSSSSLSPLVPDVAQATADLPVATMSGQSRKGISNSAYTDSGSEAIYENVPTMTGVPPHEPAFFGPRNKLPPLSPPGLTPRFNDSGGQVGIISPNWKPPEPRRYREIWNSRPFEFPPQSDAPLPATRHLSDNYVRQYSMRNDANGTPHLSSRVLVQLNIAIRGKKK